MTYPLDGTSSYRLVRYGRVHTELRSYQNLRPTAPSSGPTGTLHHMFGVHAYTSTFGGDEVIGLDLRFHNGHSGVDLVNPDDDPLDRVYFQRIELTVPSAWYAHQGFEDPMFGASYVAGGRRVIAIVEPNPDGTMHTMRWQGQMHRRVMLSTDRARDAARQYVGEAAGLAFCRRGFDPQEGHEYWSWWNRGTARYWTQKYPLPSLEHVGLASLRQRDRREYDEMVGYLTHGGSSNGYPVPHGNLGWAHPYGVQYGGMTSGQEIFVYDGVVTASSANRLGVQAHRGHLRMATDRQWTALYDADGSPSGVLDWLVVGRYIPFEHFVHPKVTPGGDPFGVTAAPTFQIDYVRRTGKQPAYEAVLDGYDAHDYQHFIRYTRSAKVLAWLANDSLAKGELLMQAENFNLAYHPYLNPINGGADRARG